MLQKWSTPKRVQSDTIGGSVGAELQPFHVKTRWIKGAVRSEDTLL